MPPKNAIGFEIKTLSNLIKRRIDLNISQQNPVELTGMQGWIIGYLFDHQDQDVFQRDIEARFNIRRSTATGVLQRMEKKGLIRREFYQNDARLKKLVLTPEAIDIHENVIREIDRIESRLSAGLTASELETFFTLIAKIRKSIE
ncbi:MAG: MarR family transcriptional regulator [Chloroflexi bacterium]|nr:MarR family transcriptional regulator [Chloroflexota bacterium]